MEKLVYVLWKRPEDSPLSFKQRMLGEVAQTILQLGVRGLTFNLADELAEYAQGIRITRMPDPISGTVSVWLDTHLRRAPVEDTLTGATARTAGYLVVESVPIVNTTHVAPRGERTPGITTVAFLEKPERLTHEAWRTQWQEHHTQVAIETQSTFSYIQNLVVRPLTPGAPPWAAIVEEGFPAEAAVNPEVFYDAVGSPEKLKENQQRMIESCGKFIDFDRIESHPMSTYVFGPATAAS